MRAWSALLSIGLALVGAVCANPTSALAAGARKEAILLSHSTVNCHMVDDHTSNGSWAYCWSWDQAGRETPVHAKLSLSGDFSTTTKTSLPSGLGGPIPPVPFHIDLGPFRCEDLGTGVQCTVLVTGKGFLIDEHEVKAVARGPIPTPVLRHPGTWMAGPGCGGRTEWFAHPTAFPYFCDGAAVVVRARWRHWGAATAKATATMDEADLRTGKSVGTAPRIRSAVTITASRIVACKGRRVYRSVVIHFDRPVGNGLSTLHFGNFLPRGC